MNNDNLSNALSKILNAEKSGKNICTLRPTSGTVREVLNIMNQNGYVGEVKEENDTRGKKITIALIGSINKCGSIKPRFPVKKDSYERFEKTYLPAKDFGLIIVSTQKGMMTHIEAKRNSLGGKLVSYCY